MWALYAYPSSVAFGTRFLKLMEKSDVELPTEIAPYQGEPTVSEVILFLSRLNNINDALGMIGTGLDERSSAPQATHPEQEHAPEEKVEPLQHKPFMAPVTGKLQQWSCKYPAFSFDLA